MTTGKAIEILAELDAQPFDPNAPLAQPGELKYTTAEYDEANELAGPLSRYAAALRKAESEAWIYRNCHEVTAK